MDQNPPPGSAIFLNLIYVLHPFQEIAPGEGGSQGLSGNFHNFFNHSLSRSVLIYLGPLPSMFANSWPFLNYSGYRSVGVWLVIHGDQS